MSERPTTTGPYRPAEEIAADMMRRRGNLTEHLRLRAGSRSGEDAKLMADAADEIERLQSALRQVRQAIFRTASTTVWMQTPCPETACDFIESILGEHV